MNEHVLTGERRSLSESCGWIFVDAVPLLYEKKRVARQLQVETWLDLSQLVKELNINDVGSERLKSKLASDYVV